MFRVDGHMNRHTHRQTDMTKLIVAFRNIIIIIIIIICLNYVHSKILNL